MWGFCHVTSHKIHTCESEILNTSPLQSSEKQFPLPSAGGDAALSYSPRSCGTKEQLMEAPLRHPATKPSGVCSDLNPLFFKKKYISWALRTMRQPLQSVTSTDAVRVHAARCQSVHRGCLNRKNVILCGFSKVKAVLHEVQNHVVIFIWVWGGQH